MPFTPVFATGFEIGSMEIFPPGDANEASIFSTNKHTGAYSCYIGNNTGAFLRIAVSGSEYYVAFWVLQRGQFEYGDGLLRCEAVLSDGKIIDIRRNTVTNTYDAYVDGVLAASGAVSSTPTGWAHLQIHFNIADAGNIDTKIDGVTDIVYTGDTQPGASSTISYIRFYMPSTSKSACLDDVAVGVGGWPGDIRVSAITPNADVTTQWTPTPGPDHYSAVDEIPLDDADYVSTTANAQRDLYAMTTLDMTGKTILGVVQWVRAKKAEADASQLKLVNSDGVATRVGAAQNLSTSYTYLSNLMTTAPDDGAWTQADLDALQLGFESVIL